MKKIVIYMMVVVFMFSGLAIAGKKDKRKQQRGYDQGQEQRDVRQYQKKHGNKNRGRHYGHGYRDRYYGHRNHPPKRYRGHWRSWESWDHYYRQHRHEYKHRRYYRDDRGRLYFEFETEEGRFSFSIGR